MISVKNPNWYLYPILSVSVSLFGYFVYKNLKTPTNVIPIPYIQQQDDKQIIIEEFQDLEKSRELLISLSKSIKIDFIDEGILNKQSLFKYCTESIKTITEKQLKQIYQMNRKSRRKHFNQINNDIHEAEKYFKCVCIFDNQIQFLIEKSQKDLAVFLDLDYQVIDRTIDYYLKKQQDEFRNQLSEFSVSLRESIKKNLKNTKQGLDLDTIKKVIEFQIQILKQDKDSILQIIKKLELEQEDHNFIPSFVYLYVFDKIYEKFALQEEDILQTNYSIFVNEDIRMLNCEWNDLQQKLMQEIANLQL